MNKELLHYKFRFISCILLLGYAYIHFQLTGIYAETTFNHLIDLSARLPFNQRLLVPVIVNWLSHRLPIDVNISFFILEWVFISLFYFALLSLLQEEFEPRPAQLLSWLCLLILPLMTVINYRFPYGGIATFFYPYDTATLFFMTAGFLFCLRSQWYYFIPCVFISTFNRESSILLVLLIPTLHWQTLRTVMKPLLWTILAYLVARLIINQVVYYSYGNLFEWYYNETYTHFEANLIWLVNDTNFLLFFFCIIGLPLFWFGFFDYIPHCYRPLRYLAFFYFFLLLIVGNFMEARIFSEIFVFLFLPVCLAIKNWLTETRPSNPPLSSTLSYYLDRYAILSLLFVIVMFRFYLNEGVVFMAKFIH